MEHAEVNWTDAEAVIFCLGDGCPIVFNRSARVMAVDDEVLKDPDKVPVTLVNWGINRWVLGVWDILEIVNDISSDAYEVIYVGEPICKESCLQ
jgi:hypothetical protein